MVLGTIAVSVLVLAMATFAILRAGRLRLYEGLAARSRSIRDEQLSPEVLSGSVESSGNFDRRLIRFPNALPPATFATLRSEIEVLVEYERSYLPSHKQGGTVAYETLLTKAPKVVALYYSKDFQDWVSRLVGMPIVPTPLHDQSSLSVLFYDKPGDHIGWHYDYNFYRGRHFTVLLAVVNEGHGGDGLSAAQLMARMADGDETVPTPPNTIVVFEGARVIHKVTPIATGERRIMLSMTYCTDPRNTLLQGIARRIKDMAFFGVRALWT
jgi:2OG-Fe(II) oxygenase superfamily